MFKFNLQRFQKTLQGVGLLGASLLCVSFVQPDIAAAQDSAVSVPPIALEAPAGAAGQDASRPVLVISNSPVPKTVLQKAYSYPVQGRDITPSQILGSAYYTPTETMVSRKLRDLKSELAILQDKVVLLSKALAGLQRENESLAASYFAAVATINTQLQVGTTPGNPRLLDRYSVAEESLETLGTHLAQFNDLSIDASKVATEASFLLDSARATYGLSGAVEEDHVALAEMEDKINAMVVLIERVLNTVSDDISRTSNYLTTERDNLRTLSLAVASGTLYGKSLADRPFSGVRELRPVAAPAAASAGTAAPYVIEADLEGADVPVSTSSSAAASMSPPEQRPLVKIRFDRNDVEFEQPLYMAVNEVMERYPEASFNVVALHSSLGGAAQTAIESTRSRRNAQKVVRTLSQIGVRGDKVSVSYDESADVDANEVHVYIY